MGHPLLASAFKAVLYAVPLVASSVAVLLVARFGPSLPSRALWLAMLAVVAVAVSVGVERVVRRLLPLATLLRLTMLFPDKAPSRYKVARTAGNAEVLAQRLAKKRDTTALGAAEQVLALITALGNHDRRTRGHSERVRIFADLLAEELHLDQGSRDRLRWASLLHDLGKLSVAATILNKPAKLDDREFALMKLHPERGAELAAPLLPWLGDWGRGILDHHEKYDGKGYPAGLSGTDISIAGRVIGLVDAFETMTAARPYKKPMATKAARQELTDCAGAHFDPVMVRAFLSVSLPRLVWAMGPLSFLVQLPFLGALAQTGSRATQLGGQAAVTASNVATAGIVATAGVLPLAAYTPPPPVPASASAQTPPAAAAVTAATPVGDVEAAPAVAAEEPLAVEPEVAPAPEPFPSPTTEVLPSPDAFPVTAEPVAPFPAASRAPAAATAPSPLPSPTRSADSRAVPELTITQEPAVVARSADVSLVFASDLPATFQCSLDGGAWETCTSPLQLTGLANGEHTVAVRAVHANGAQSPEHRSVFTVAVPPPVVLDAAPSGTRTSPGVAVTFHSPDAAADAFQCRLDDAAWIGCADTATAEAPATWTVFPDNGEHEVFVRAASPLGGWGEPVSTGVFRMAVLPVVVLSEPPSGTVTDAVVEIAFSSPDPSVQAFSCSVDGAPWATCSSPLVLALDDGDHVVRVRATSPAGTGEPVSTGTFTVDAAPPTVSLLQVPQGTVATSEVELRFASDQPDATFDCRVDGSPYDACTSPLLLSLTNGQHTVDVRATSARTGTGAAATATFVVDAPPPTGPDTVLDGVPADIVATAGATVSFSSVDPDATFRCSIDGRAAETCTSPWTLTGLPNGRHTVRVHAVSASGAVGAAVSTSFTTAVPPTVVLQQVPSGTVTDSATVTAAWSSDRPDAVFACAVDDGALVSCTSPWSTQLANGDHTLTVRATDPVTGAISTTTTATFTVAVPPETTITAAPDGTVGRTFSLSFGSDQPGSAFECVADGGAAWATCASGDTFSLPDGHHTMSVRALSAGALGPPVTTASFLVAGDPVLALAAAPETTTSDRTATFTWELGTGDVTYECRLGTASAGGTFTACSSGVTYQDLAPGSYRFDLRSRRLDPNGVPYSAEKVTFTWTVV